MKDRSSIQVNFQEAALQSSANPAFYPRFFMLMFTIQVESLIIERGLFKRANVLSTNSGKLKGQPPLAASLKSSLSTRPSRFLQLLGRKKVSYGRKHSLTLKGFSTSCFSPIWAQRPLSIPVKAHASLTHPFCTPITCYPMKLFILECYTFKMKLYLT